MRKLKAIKIKCILFAVRLERNSSPEKTQHISCFDSFFFLEIGSGLFFLRGLETKTQMTNINCPLSVLFCSVKVSEGNCMLQPSTTASKRKGGKKKKNNHATQLCSFCRRERALITDNKEMINRCAACKRI